jgi:hypothetical protein
MTTYKIHINDRNYESWEVFETTTFKKINFDFPFDPIKGKLFSNDVFSISEVGTINIIHSAIRTGPPSPGVLVLSDNKSYGRESNGRESNGRERNVSKQGRLLYKCIPDDKRLPTFLVPYEIKDIGFSKVYKNLYVTFTYKQWDEKHPRATLSHVIGTVDVLDNFYEYQLYCKSLNASIQQFQRAASKTIDLNAHDEIINSIKLKYPSIQDRTDQTEWHILTIDPHNSFDFDDGYSIKPCSDGGHMISIYISNVTIWMDIFNLWDSFSRRISTIYLPDKKRPMLPTVLSECLCSLQENVTRVAFVMDAFVKDNDIIDIRFSNAFIKVFKNYRYEEPSLNDNNNYKLLFDITRNLSKKFKYIPNVRNSHEMVCYLMVLMNYHAAKRLLDFRSGIFRTTIIKRDINIPDNIPEDVGKFIKIWNSSSGQYLDGSLLAENGARHELLDIEAYIHITSPIRRLVDLLNIMKLQQCIGIITLSDNGNAFYTKWLKDLEYINVTMRSIRKIQCDCSLLDLCFNHPEVMEKEYDGFLFDKIDRNDGLHQFIVYLPELKLSSRITLRDNIENFDKRKFKLFLFIDEEHFKKKIRIQLL